MVDDKTIDEKRFTLTWKVAIPVMASLLIISNTFTLQISQIEQNAIDNVDNNEANKRRLKHAIEKQDFKNTIILLEFKLDECNENK